jgi:hypothetical protein
VTYRERKRRHKANILQELSDACYQMEPIDDEINDYAWADALEEVGAELYRRAVRLTTVRTDETR